MRLVTFDADGGRMRPGAMVPTDRGDAVLDLGAAGVRDVVELLAAPPERFAEVRAVVATAPAEALRPLGTVRLGPPVTPRTIWCLGYNYRGHVPDGTDPARDDPEFPDVFVKTANVLRGPDDPVVLPPAAQHVDYEGEIAVVVGARAHRVPLARAMDHVAGYVLFNDVSSRDWQARTSQWELGKCFDGFGPLGPWIVTADELADIDDQVLEVERDGVVTVRQNTSTMVFDVASLVHYLSQVATLEPGDVISTGTPQKLPEAAAAHRPLAHGDAVTVRAPALGELTTTFVDPEATVSTVPGGLP